MPPGGAPFGSPPGDIPEKKILRKRIALMLALVICAGALCGCAGKTKSRYTASFLELFDTVTSIVGYAESQEAFTEEVTRVRDELEAYDHLYDIYNEYDGMVNLRTINLNAGGEPLEVDQKIIDLLLFAREVDEKTDHRVNAMMGSVLEIWHEAREEGINDPENAALPDMTELQAAAEHVGFDLLEIDEENRTVRITDPEARLDVGALAKGYATQKVCETMPEGYLVSVGGNVVATGKKADGTAWTIGIQDPDGDGTEYLHKVSLEKGSVVTSGDYQRYYTVDGKEYHHIIDPDTLMPGERWRAVTVIGTDSAEGDALSTALFLMSREDGQKLLDGAGAEAMWIEKDGTRLYSPGYEAYIKP